MTQAFNLSQFANKVNTSGQADLTTAVTGTLPVANGGTGAASLTGNSVAITNAGGTALSTVAAGASGNVLTSDGTTWTSAASSGGQFQTQLFTAPGTWTKPASATQVRVTVIGGGGGASFRSPTSPSVPGAPGGVATAIVPVSAPVTITIGSGGTGGTGTGTPGTTGGTSSFGPAVSATGGVGGLPGPSVNPQAPGTGTVSVGTALRTLIGYPVSNVLSTDGIDMKPNILNGAIARYGPAPSAAIAFSTSGAAAAGANGTNQGTPFPGTGGVGGAILVEFVG